VEKYFSNELALAAKYGAKAQYQAIPHHDLKVVAINHTCK
jgi:hypothetical protein